MFFPTDLRIEAEFNKMSFNRIPTHPGAILRDDVLPELKLSVSEVATNIRVTRQQLYRVLAEKSGISSEMALRLGKFLGNGPDFWLRLQENYDVAKAKEALAGELSLIPFSGDLVRP